jgi:hypothetical protein
MLDLNTTFEVVSRNEEQDSIVVRPCSPLLQKPKTDYDCVNVTLSLLDKEKNLDLQIKEICDEQVIKLLLQESDKYNSEIAELNDYKNPNKVQYTIPELPPINFIV